MALALKDLTDLNSAITLNCDHDKSGVATVQYRSGAGTLVLEGTLDGDNWESIIVVASDDTTEAPAATMTATGMYIASFGGLKSIRVRKSVGGAELLAALSITEF